MRLLHSITGVVVSVPVLLVVLAINGGYVYRTRCPHIQGSTETSWSYRIYEILPYIGYSRTGCQVHTATRVALDWVGLWKLPSAQPVAAGAPSTGHQGEYTGDQIAS